MGHSLILLKMLSLKLVFIALLSPNPPGEKAIRCISPGYGSFVTITNETTQTWWDNYTLHSGVKMAAKKEYIRPEPVILRWEKNDQAKAGYEIAISTDPTFENKQIYHTARNNYKLYNLYGGKQYYWRVRCRGKEATPYSRINMFVTRKCARTIKVKGAYNMRDLGGYTTYSGRMVRQGLVYRSGNYDSVKREGKETIKKLGIKTQLDVRRKGEGKFGEKTLPVKKYKAIKGHAYERIYRSESRAKRTIKIMKMFAHEENYPITFHCIYGRDRTGTIAFLLNGMLGVTEKDLYRDYEMTFLSKHSGSHAKQKIKRFEKFYRKMRKYKNPHRNLQYNIKAYLKDYGMTEDEIKEIERIMLE